MPRRLRQNRDVKENGQNGNDYNDQKARRQAGTF